MKKNTFFALFFCAMLGGCAIIESSPVYGSEAIRSAELGAEPTTDAEIYAHLAKVNPEATPGEIEALTFAPDAYTIILTEDKILVVDPETHKIILSEDYDSKSSLAQAIFKDNE